MHHVQKQVTSLQRPDADIIPSTAGVQTHNVDVVQCCNITSEIEIFSQNPRTLIQLGEHHDDTLALKLSMMTRHLFARERQHQQSIRSIPRHQPQPALLFADNECAVRKHNHSQFRIPQLLLDFMFDPIQFEHRSRGLVPWYCFSDNPCRSLQAGIFISKASLNLISVGGFKISYFLI